MRDDLLLYYQQELSYLRQLGAEFAQKYPKVAGRLILEADKCDDPHVERLLEAFAFLAARVHLKIDDEFPEITEALLSILYPHYIRPLPSMSIVEMHLDAEQGGAASPQKIPRGAVLNSRPVAGVPCQFRTCFDTTVLPIKVAAGEWTSPDRLSPPVKSLDAVAAIRVEFRAPQDILVPQLGIDTLRIHISGEGAPVRTRRRVPLAGARGMGRSAVGGRWSRAPGKGGRRTGPPGDGSAVRFLGFGPLVPLPVVEGAEQPAVLLGGQAPVGPLDDVVTLAGTGRLVAVLVHTALVTHLEDPS